MKIITKRAVEFQKFGDFNLSRDSVQNQVLQFHTSGVSDHDDILPEEDFSKGRAYGHATHEAVRSVHVSQIRIHSKDLSNGDMPTLREMSCGEQMKLPTALLWI